MTDKNGGGGKPQTDTPQQPQGDPGANDFTANENALGGDPNSQPSRDPQTGEEQSDGQ